MKPQVLDLDSEVLQEFREKFDKCIEILIKNLIEKGLSAGEVSGKVKIEIYQGTTEDGEIYWKPEITPSVNLKVGAKGKIDCGKQADMILKRTPCGLPVVASNQISFEDLMNADNAQEDQAKGA